MAFVTVLFTVLIFLWIIAKMAVSIEKSADKARQRQLRSQLTKVEIERLRKIRQAQIDDINPPSL